MVVYYLMQTFFISENCTIYLGGSDFRTNIVRVADTSKF